MVTFLETKQCGDWWPLTEDGRFSGEQWIAGKSLREWQQNNALDDAFMLENAWVSVEDWRRLEVIKDGCLVDSEGHILAYRGDGAGARYQAKSSFLVLYVWDVLRVNEQIIGVLDSGENLGEMSAAAHVDGIVSIGKGTRILPGVYIEGNVVIGEHCKIGPNCYIRGNTAIGDRVRIGQSVEVKNSIIGHGSSVGHLSYVGDSILGENVNFGASTVTSNYRHDQQNHRTEVKGQLLDTGRLKFGTVVGDSVHTGIHTAIYPGRKLGPKTTTLPSEIVDSDVRKSI